MLTLPQMQTPSPKRANLPQKADPLKSRPPVGHTPSESRSPLRGQTPVRRQTPSPQRVDSTQRADSPSEGRPPFVDRMTDTCINITFTRLATRAVIIDTYKSMEWKSTSKTAKYERIAYRQTGLTQQLNRTQNAQLSFGTSYHSFPHNKFTNCLLFHNSAQWANWLSK